MQVNVVCYIFFLTKVATFRIYVLGNTAFFWSRIGTDHQLSPLSSFSLMAKSPGMGKE